MYHSRSWDTIYGLNLKLVMSKTPIIGNHILEDYFQHLESCQFSLSWREGALILESCRGITASRWDPCSSVAYVVWKKDAHHDELVRYVEGETLPNRDWTRACELLVKRYMSFVCVLYLSRSRMASDILLWEEVRLFTV